MGLAALTACASAERENGTTVDAAGSNVIADARPDSSFVLIDAPPPVDGSVGSACTTSMTCQSAQMLGTVSGDSGADMLSANGYQAAWFKVRVTEDDGDAFGLTLRLEAALTSPTPGAFQVFVYVNADSDVVECTTPSGDRLTSGNIDDVLAEWGEGFFSNGDDDGRTVAIEVRPMTSTCSASATWQLDVYGN